MLSLRRTPTAPTAPVSMRPRLYVVGDELAVEGKASFTAPVLLPTPSAVATLSTDALVALMMEEAA